MSCLEPSPHRTALHVKERSRSKPGLTQIEAKASGGERRGVAPLFIIINAKRLKYMLATALLAAAFMALLLVTLGTGGASIDPGWYEWWPHVAESRLEALIESAGPWAVGASIGLMVMHSFVPFPAELVGIANGMIYGPLWGTVITWVGAMLGAFLAFGLARRFGRPFVRKMLAEKRIEKMDAWAAQHGPGALLFSRFIPAISFNLINYAAGLMNVPWWTFAWTTGLGILPLTVLMVVMGDQIETMPWQVWLILLGCGLLLWLVTHRIGQRVGGAGTGRAARDRTPPAVPPTSTSSAGVRLYRVTLQCRAAPGLGCGSRAKPVMLALEHTPAIAQAWLNRSGDLLAVRWKGASARNQLLRAVLQAHGLTAKELVGSARAKALRGFPSDRDWYRTAEVDRLSEEEAQIIAARLVRRLRKRLPLPGGKAESVRLAFAEVCQHELTHHPAEPEQARRQRIAREVLKTSRHYLDEREIAVLREVLALGHRPLPDEL